MPMSRALKNKMRKAISPKSGTRANNQGVTDGHDVVKQDKATGPKYNGPNYPQAGLKINKSALKLGV